VCGKDASHPTTRFTVGQERAVPGPTAASFGHKVDNVAQSAHPASCPLPAHNLGWEIPGFPVLRKTPEESDRFRTPGKTSRESEKPDGFMSRFYTLFYTSAGGIFLSAIHRYPLV